jgi:hypothetical protein
MPRYGVMTRVRTSLGRKSISLVCQTPALSTSPRFKFFVSTVVELPAPCLSRWEAVAAELDDVATTAVMPARIASCDDAHLHEIT